MEQKNYEVRAGQFLAPPGFEHWILKFDGLGEDKELGISTQYGRIEYAYHLMAHAAGMQLSESRLLEENGRAHFMTKRFDRENNNKSHIQTLCAMAHLDYKQRGTHSYSQFFTTMQALKLKPAAFSEAFRRMAFNVLALNRDDHTKNISFLLSEGKEWELAPAYDITYAYNPKGEWTYQHLMSVQGKFSGITKRDLLLHADMFRVAGAKTILNQVTDAVRDWDRYAREAKLAESERMRIALQIKNELKEFLT